MRGCRRVLPLRFTLREHMLSGSADRWRAVDDTVRGSPARMNRAAQELFARRWADAISGASYVSMGPAELVEAALATEFDPSVGRRIGVDMVDAHFTGTETLGATVALIVERLPDLLGHLTPGVNLTSRVARLAGTVAAGYANALRERSLDEQDSIYRAGLRARRQTEQALTASEARFRGVFHASPVAIAISDPDGRILQTNPSLDDTLGYRPGELLGRQLTELFALDDRPTVEEHYRSLVTGRESRFRVRFPLRLA